MAQRTILSSMAIVVWAWVVGHSSNMALWHHVHMAPLHTSLSRTLPSEGLVTQQDIKASKYNIDASKYNKYQSLNIKWNIRIVRPQNTKAHRDVRSQYIKKVFFFGEKQSSPKTKKNMSTWKRILCKLHDKRTFQHWKNQIFLILSRLAIVSKIHGHCQNKDTHAFTDDGICWWKHWCCFWF